MKIKSTKNDTFILKSPWAPYFWIFGILVFPLFLGIVYFALISAAVIFNNAEFPIGALVIAFLLIGIPLALLVFFKRKHSFEYILEFKNGYIKFHNPKDKENTVIESENDCVLQLFEWWEDLTSDDLVPIKVYRGPLLKISSKKLNILIGLKNRDTSWNEPYEQKYTKPFYLYQKNWDQLIKALNLEDMI